MLEVVLCIIIGLSVLFNGLCIAANIRTLRMIKDLERRMDKHGR